MSVAVADRYVSDTPIAILDFETTGLNAGVDRVVEVSVMRMEPGQNARLVLDTLVNPERPMAATEIHGITDADVIEAPVFRDIASDVIRALSGAVLAAYNVYFDIRFLQHELRQAGVAASPPHLCLMYLRPMLDLGPRCRLGEACMAHGIDFTETHIAARDVQASCRLMEIYLREIEQKNIRTFSDLAQLRNYKFVESFFLPPLTWDDSPRLKTCSHFVSRSGPVGASVTTTSSLVTESGRIEQRPLVVYWDALKAVIADLEITDEELAHLKLTEERLGLQPEQVRVLHARAFASAISQFTQDQWLDNREARKLKRLHQCLSALGWAPGE